MLRILTAFAGFSVIVSSAAAQQPQPLGAPLCAAAVEAGCQCAVQLPAQGNGIAQITSANGTVIVTRDASASGDAVVNEFLSANDRVVTGQMSSAGLLVGASCDLPVGPESIVTLSAIEGCACANVTSNAEGVGAQFGPGGTGGGVLVGTLGTLLFTIVPGIIEEATEDDEDVASPVEFN